MIRPFRGLAALALLWLGWGVTTATAQVRYPAGYGGYGWHGWGGGTPAGRTAAGMGVFAAGAGQAAANVGERNVENSQARSVNAQTAMGVNNYIYECNQRNAQVYYGHLAQNQKEGTAALNQIQDRILNHPLEADIAGGDTLNAIMAEITNPKVYGRTLELAQQPLSSAMVKNLPFEYAAGGITYSLMELTSRDNVPAIYQDPAFAAQRKAIRSIATELQKESTAQRSPKPETIRNLQAALNRVKATLEGLPNLDQIQKFEAEKYLKALYGLTKMLDSPSYDVYLAAVEQQPSVPLSEVLTFMHAFNLRFGAAKTPVAREYYSQLYSALSNLRQAVNPPPGEAQSVGQNGPARDDRVTNFFGGMDYQHVAGSNAPPPPPQPR